MTKIHEVSVAGFESLESAALHMAKFDAVEVRSFVQEFVGDTLRQADNDEARGRVVLAEVLRQVARNIEALGVTLVPVAENCFGARIAQMRYDAVVKVLDVFLAEVSLEPEIETVFNDFKTSMQQAWLMSKQYMKDELALNPEV